MRKPKLPNIRERINPSGQKVYMLDYFDIIENKRKRPIIGSRKQLAQLKANQIYNEMMERYVGIPDKGKKEITLTELFIAFFNSKANRISKGTLKRYKIYETHFTRFFIIYFSKVNHIHQIKKEYIELHLQKLFEENKAPKTVNGHLTFVKALFNFGVEEKYIIESPAQRIRPFPLPNSRKVEYWTKEEITAILNASSHHWRDHFEFLVNTGLRKGELMNLTWDDVDLNNNPPRITIQAKKDWQPKTNTLRPVPLNETAVNIISRLSKSDFHNYVFKGVEGGKVHKDRIYNAIQRILNGLGLQGNLHKLRHTFASHLVMSGVGLETVSKLLGHSSIEMTMKYAHLAPDHLYKAVQQLNLKSDKESKKEVPAQIVKPQPAVLANPDTKEKP